MRGSKLGILSAIASLFTIRNLDNRSIDTGRKVKSSTPRYSNTVQYSRTKGKRSKSLRSRSNRRKSKVKRVA